MRWTGARRSAPAAADGRLRASAPRSQFGRTCIEGGWETVAAAKLSMKRVGWGLRRGVASLLVQGRGAGLVVFKNRLRGHVGSSWNGVWLPVAKKRYFRPLRLLDEATAGARWRVVELALGLRWTVARRSAPAAADGRVRASAPRSQFGRTCFEGGWVTETVAAAKLSMKRVGWGLGRGVASLLVQGRGAGLVGCSRTAFGGTCLVLEWGLAVGRKEEVLPPPSAVG